MPYIRLGFDLNCFTNRFPEPEEWTRVTHELGIREVQFNADLLDPFLPWNIQERLAKKTLKLCRERDIYISCHFGGDFHHQSYLCNYDDESARWYENFYRRLIVQASLFGAKGTGVCYGIMSIRDAENPKRKKEVLKRASESYVRLSRFAKKQGLEYLMFETTSVPRECCATFAETDYVLNLMKDTAVPMKICLDVGHRNLKNPKSPEADYCGWIRRYGRIAPVIHLQQTEKWGSSHWPFTPEYNKKGIVKMDQLIKAIEDSGSEGTLLALELRVRAFYPFEYRFMDIYRETIKYLRRWVKA